MEAQYNPHLIEKQVQKLWQDTDAYKTTHKENAPYFYALSMFPYPSGHLHMGHVRNYTITDVIARFKRMQGYNLLHPMGWDAFGLPAENKAIATGNSPQKWTYDNINYMKKQLQRLGFCYDWSREVATCDPDYYALEQAFFIDLYEKGLVYRKKALVNWDPVDCTVLANEQVIEGRGWRSGALVEKREMTQWFIQITDYAERLLNDLDGLDGWPAQVKQMQRHWIGRSTGVEITFPVLNKDGTVDKHCAPLAIYTTRADTLFGATYVAIAAEHPLVHSILQHPDVNDTQKHAISSFVDEIKHTQVNEATIETMEKRGLATGVYVAHPLTGEPLPIWIANFVLMNYGTGAVISVPAHDARDFAFAKAYDLPIKQVIKPANNDDACDISQAAYIEKGIVINSGAYDNLESDSAIAAIASELEQNKWGKRSVNYRINDWAISRQRYWGAPIPMVHCDTCGVLPVDKATLPVRLPEEVVLDGKGSPLAKLDSFVTTKCRQCGASAKRETDTFDTFFESSWYFLHFASDTHDTMVDKQAHKWLPVNQYVGGIEHAVMHLLYARFFYKALLDLGYNLPGNEPFANLLTQGMVLADTYYSSDAKGNKQWHSPDVVAVKRTQKGTLIEARLADGTNVTSGGKSKMSKSKNNGVDPQEMIDAYGADAVRLFMMFAAPPEQSLEWSQDGVEGSYRFLKRLYAFALSLKNTDAQTSEHTQKVDTACKQVRRLIHLTIQKATDDIDRRHKFNTAVAALMEIFNHLQKLDITHTVAREVGEEGLQAVLLLLAPMTPHICDYLWQALYATTIADSTLPKVDESALAQEQVTIVVQVNGKVRASIQMPPNASKEALENAARAHPNVAKFLSGLVRKVIVVPSKLVNFVV